MNPHLRSATTGELVAELERRGLEPVTPELLRELYHRPEQGQLDRLREELALLRAGCDDRQPMYLQLLRESVPALTWVAVVAVVGIAVAYPIAVALGTLEHNAADAVGAVLSGVAAGAVATFLLCARLSGAEIRRLDEELAEHVRVGRYRRDRLADVRAMADELLDDLGGNTGPGDLLGVPPDRDPWAREDRRHAIAVRTIAHVARDGMAGHVVFDQPDDWPHAGWLPADGRTLPKRGDG